MKLIRFFLPILIPVLVIAIWLLTIGLGKNDNTATSDGTPLIVPSTIGTPNITGGNFVRASLRVVNSCDTLLEHFKTEALKIVGPNGLGGQAPIGLARLFNDNAEAIAPAAPNSGGTPDFSSTNVQVKGVDEPDIVKTDGRRIVGVSNGELWVADASTTPAVRTGGLTLSTDFQSFNILLYKDKVLVFANSPFRFRGFTSAKNMIYTRIIEIDISSAKPQILNEVVVEGEYVSARQVGSTVNIVLQSQKSSQLPFVYPANNNSADQAERVNRQVITNSKISDWLPSYQLLEGENRRVIKGQISPCNEVRIPDRWAGLDLLSIITVDMENSLPAQGTASVLASGSTVYSSGTSLYVSHPVYNAPTRDNNNGITLTPVNEVWFHKFATPTGNTASYLSSGQAEGRILNQFAMNETADGYFWIVTTANTNEIPTDGNTFAERAIPTRSESFVTSFREDENQLILTGKVGNLGKNETVQSVRFIGNKAYVVTFRRIDPFYVVDLSDPNNPFVAGELKIPGFSSYLHPLGNDRLLGVGRSATDEGRVTGGKLSLFDASVPTNPLETAVLELGQGFSNVGWDHRAFLYWQPANRMVMPYRSYQTRFAGAIVVDVNPDGTPGNRLRELERFSHQTIATTPDCRNQPVPEPGSDIINKSVVPDSCLSINSFEEISRTLVIGNTLWSLSENFLEARNIATLKMTDSLRITS